MTLLDKAKRYRHASDAGHFCLCYMSEDYSGNYFRTDEPVLLAMERLCEASIAREECPSLEMEEWVVEAIAALLKLREDKP